MNALTVSFKNFVPVATSLAGYCLTAADWQLTSTEYLAFYFEEILVKPGIETILQSSSLAKMFAWSGKTVLDASRIIFNKNDHFTVRSRYDGMNIKVSKTEISRIIQALKPDYLVSDLDFGQDLPVSTKQLTSKDYQIGDYDARAMQVLANDNLGIQSDKPAADGLAGLLYTDSGTINILDKAHIADTNTIAIGCNCPSCHQNFTRAYFHHLLQHTPLLAQRLLIQHNIYYCQLFTK